jgi:F-box/leucine-rich repeat protein 14
VARCAVLCLRSRLETVEWLVESTDDTDDLHLRLLGANNSTLTSLDYESNKLAGWAHLRELRGLKCLRLNVHGLEVSMVPLIGTLQTLEVLDLTSHPVKGLKGLRGLTALRELSLRSTAVTNAHFVGLEQLLARLHKLDLSECEKLKAISNLAPATSLRELTLARSGVEDLQGLQKLVALETLNVKCIPARDWSVVQKCPRLAHLTAEVSGVAYSTEEVQEMVDSAAHCLVRWRLDSSVDERGARATLGAPVQPPSFLRCAVLRELDLYRSNVDNAAIAHLAIPTLEVLQLGGNPVDDVSGLAGCRALRELSLRFTEVTDEGIVGLEEIVTLEQLDLSFCFRLKAVANLRHCVALRELSLEATSITNASLEGLEHIVTLTKLSINRCWHLTSVSTLRHSPSLRELDISFTELAGAGIAGLEEIGTLERLVASDCRKLDDIAMLRHCRALQFLNLQGSSVTDASMAALACVATLEILNLSLCRRLRDVSALSESVSLRELDLSATNVDNAGIAGLERIATLTSLQLEACKAVTDVKHLVLSKSLRELDLWSSGVTDAGIAGIEMAPALEVLILHMCPGIAEVAAVERRAAEYAVKVRFARESDAESQSTEEA